jgi:NADPH-dependent 2,4-dienoyl-CoA reductase/sulfur reductase-like enzyme
VTLAPMFVPRGHIVEAAAAVKAAVGVPVIAVGRLDDPILAERIVSEGAADLVALGRSLIADPEWPAKVLAGRVDDIRPCIACNACVDLVGRGEIARCAVNPEVGREHEWRLAPADRPRRVMVVGAGPAGMEAARIARLRGHEVSLWERDRQLGGKLDVASRAPSKDEVLRFREYEERVLERLGVAVHLGVDVTRQLVERERPDVVVVAAGADAWAPPIAGLDSPRVVDAQDLLLGRTAVTAGQQVVVIGGSATGCETAEHLSEVGARVTIVELLPSIGHGIEPITRRYLVKELRRRGVDVLTGARVEAVRDGEVCYREEEGELRSIPADVVALAVGWRPRGDQLARSLEGFEVLVVGDAARPADFVAAVNAGADAGLAA